ncbi:MAG: Rdx family protein [Maioricimonas sp. JB045]
MSVVPASVARGAIGEHYSDLQAALQFGTEPPGEFLQGRQALAMDDCTIYYCRTCRFRPVAEKIAEAIQREFGVQSRLVEGVWGTFRVVYRGEEVFNRWTSRGWIGRLGFGHKPTPDEIVLAIRSRQAAHVSPAVAD